MQEVLGFSPLHSKSKMIPLYNRRKDEAYLVFILDRLDGSEIDVKLLNDTWIQRIEVHHEDMSIPKTSLGLKDKTTFILVAFSFLLAARVTYCIFVWFLFHGGGLFAIGFVRTDVFKSVEFMEQDVFIAFGTTSIKGLIP